MWKVTCVHTLDLCGRRSAGECLRELGQGRARPGGNHFHRAVVEVAREAAEVERFGLPQDKPAETHTLHAPAD
ncbi:MAG TPA: hypothetical protein VGV12_06360 [Gemmatimonadales bacterium]|nr:hypothetical protein [Gemmatimonadales bacterium]